MKILGFDPGKDKCGVAVMDSDYQLYHHQVVPSSAAIATISQLSEEYHISLIVMGDQTTSKAWQAKLQAQLPSLLPLVKVDERYSSLEARDRYWQIYPPQGLRRLIPQGMRLPPRPVDDIVAIILIERYLQQN